MKLKAFPVYWERFHPWFVAAIAAAAWWYMELSFPASPDSLFGTAATVASVFASFLGVGKGLILTIKNTETYKILQRNNYLEPFYAYLSIAIWSAVAFAAVSVTGFFVYAGGVQSPTADRIKDIYKVCWIFLAVLSLLTYVRFGRILFRLLKQA